MTGNICWNANSTLLSKVLLHTIKPSAFVITTPPKHLSPFAPLWCYSSYPKFLSSNSWLSILNSTFPTLSSIPCIESKFLNSAFASSSTLLTYSLSLARHLHQWFDYLTLTTGSNILIKPSTMSCLSKSLYSALLVMSLVARWASVALIISRRFLR